MIVRVSLGLVDYFRRKKKKGNKRCFSQPCDSEAGRNSSDPLPSPAWLFPAPASLCGKGSCLQSVPCLRSLHRLSSRPDGTLHSAPGPSPGAAGAHGVTSLLCQCLHKIPATALQPPGGEAGVGRAGVVFSSVPFQLFRSLVFLSSSG